ncbi:MAG: SPOR domain-containing protein [Candidatus Omnitrophota bacterium]
MVNFFKKETQLEIFDTKINTNEEKINKFLLLFQHLVKYEKVIFSFIGVAVTFLIAFSIGFERGKNINVVQIKKTNQQSNKIIVKEKAIDKDTSKQNKGKNKTETTYVTVVKKELPKQIEQPVRNIEKGAYVIQVATYFKDSFAKKEALNLKNKGFNTLVKNKGKYIILYVGNFNTKTNAENSLKKLKANYRDCFIKKLS